MTNEILFRFISRSDTFIPKHVIMITWKNMSFAGGIDNSLFRVRNLKTIFKRLINLLYAFSFSDKFIPNGSRD